MSASQPVHWSTSVLRSLGRYRATVDKDKEIALWEKKFAAQVEISEEWKANYNREHVLRLQAEGLFKMAEHKLNVSRSWGKVKSVATVAAAGVAAYALLK